MVECVTASAATGCIFPIKGAWPWAMTLDLTLFYLQHAPTVLVDAEKESLQADNILVPLAAIRAGKGYLAEQGAENAFGF